MSTFDAAVSAATIEHRWAPVDCSRRMHHTRAAFEWANVATVTARGAAFGVLMREIETVAARRFPSAARAPTRAPLDPPELPSPEGIGAGA